MSDANFIETTWDNLLSRDPAQIRLAFAALDIASQQVVRDHLQRMCSEEGWHTEQVISAETALRILQE